MRVRAVIFDMDGVITNTMPDHFKAWHQVLAKEGIHATHHDIYSREGQRGLQSVYEIFNEYKKPYDLKKAKALLHEKEELFKKITQTRFITGSRSILRDLHKRKFKLALVTGTSRHELHRILPDSVYNYFDVSVTGSDVKKGKPHPEPYLKALKKMGLKASQAVAIENAPFGILSAKKAGLKCLALETSLPRKYLKEADAVFASIKELRKKVKFILI
ncbi:MAG: hypothetical protein A2Z88_05510 [Omnitrophica WOR_2 bacterium GWA2_47_8]|nr:MAG: hypothetical protein A2Z88_05510 [Omnitrophica WOR_2 bacterium GWA2_47_8]